MYSILTTFMHYFLSVAPSSAPTDFQANVSDHTSVLLSWNPPPPEDQNGIIRHYEVVLFALATGEIHIRSSAAHSVTVSSLQPFTNYSCTVAAETVATGPYAEEVTIQTLQTGNYSNYTLCPLSSNIESGEILNVQRKQIHLCR